MKSFYLGLVLGLVPGAGLFAQETSTAPVEQPASADATAPAAAPAMNTEQLQALLGPIALYPDALIALILPASAEPSDVVLAARFVATKPTSAQIDAQPWSDSLKGLARYPDVLAWMDTNLAWTRQLGDVFVAQPTDVMNTVQGLRAQARAAGTLTDTPQQRVVVEQQVIRIEPAQPDVIYVPVYDPAIVYVRRPIGYSGSIITFGVGYPIGVWLAYECDWSRRTVWVVSPSYRTPYYRRPAPIVYVQHSPPPGYHRWTPPPSRSRPVVVGGGNQNRFDRPGNVRPALTPGANGPVRRTPDGVRYPQQGSSQPGYPQPGNRPNPTQPRGPVPPSVRPTAPLQTPRPVAPAPGLVQPPASRPVVPVAPMAPRAPVAPTGPVTPTPRPQVPQQSPRFEQRTTPPSRVLPPAGQNGQRRALAPAPAATPRVAPVVPPAPGAGAGAGAGMQGSDRHWRSSQ